MRKIFYVLCFLFMMTGVIAAQDNLTPYEIALERIEITHQTKARMLDLSDLGLTTVPPEIGQLTHLETLNLYNNKLTNLPSEIRQLSRLRNLYIHKNQFHELPLVVTELHRLEVLLINDNMLEDLPARMGQLGFLQILHAFNNQLQTLPLELGQLRNLRQLYLYGNPLSYIPGEYRSNYRVLAFLREEAERQHQAELARIEAEKQRLLLMGLSGIGLLVAIILGFRMKQRGGRKVKAKRDIMT